MIFISIINDLILGLAAASAAAGIAATIAGFLGRVSWILDLFSHFRLQYFLLLLLSSIILMLYDQINLAAASSLFALLNLILILPLYFPQPATPIQRGEEGKRKTYRAVSINVLQDNQEYARAARFIEAVQPDILLLVEVNSNWLARLAHALESLPFSIQQPREDNYGIALFSRFPIADGSVVGLISLEMPSICAEIALEGFRVKVLGTHPSPPKSKTQSEQRNLQLEEIAEFAASTPGPLVVMGDLNLSNWSPYFHELMAKSGLLDSRRGFGLLPTWPVKRPHLWVPIDHILVSPDLHVHQLEKGPYTGSDHFPITCDFSCKGN
jgi:endonuclease/exonuclease/phosphatase (EEP) superfamily protein YafD